MFIFYFSDPEYSESIGKSLLFIFNRFKLVTKNLFNNVRVGYTQCTIKASS